MWKRYLAVLMISVVSLYVSGCVALLAGGAGVAGTAVWLSGKLSKEVVAPYEATIEATEAALKSMELIVTEKTVRGEVAQIMSNYTDGRTIWIDLRPMTEAITKIDIRVGAMGDESVARDILDRIEARL